MVGVDSDFTRIVVVIFSTQMLMELCDSKSSEMQHENSCTALAIYDQTLVQPLAAFAQNFKVIEIGGRHYDLEQRWASNGVAGVVWDAAIVLSEHLSEKPEIVKGKRVLELGSGTGLPSIVAVNTGASKVIATDLPSAIPLLKRNIFKNLENDKRITIDVAELTWSRENAAQFMELDGSRTFDIIIGADIVYNEDVFDDLLDTFSTIVDVSGRRGMSSKIILAMRIRYDRDRKFLKMLREAFEFFNELYYDAQRDIHIYCCEKPRR